MRWRRIAFWLTFSTLALIVLALTWLWTADLGVFKPQLERIVTEKTGREFAIDGNFYVDLGGTSSVIAEDVRFQNADWADSDNMVTVGRVELRVDLWSLVRGPILVELIDIDDADIQLIRPENGDPNWVLPIESGGEEEDEDSAGLDILFRQVDIDQVSLVFVSPDRNRPLHLDVEYLRQLHREDDFLDLGLRATLDERQIAVDGEVGTWDALLAGRDFDFDVEAVLDTFEFSGRGRIDDVADLRRPEIEFTAAGPDIDDLTRMLGVGEEGEGDIDLKGSLTPQESGPLVLDVNGHIGQTEIEATGTVLDLQSFRNIGLKAIASGPDLGRVLRIAGVHQVREAPFMLRIDAETQGNSFVVNEASMVFAQAQMSATAHVPNFPSIDDAVIKLDIEGPDIARFRYVTGLPGAAEGAFKLGFAIDVTDEGVEVLQLDIETELAEVRGRGKLGEAPDFYSSQFELRVKSDSLERTAAAYGVAGLPDYPIELAGTTEYVDGGLRSITPLVATVGDVSASVFGFLTFEPGVIGSDVNFTLKGPDLAGLIAAFTEAEGVPAQPYDLQGRLQVGDDGYRFREITGSVGMSSIDINGLLTTRPGLGGTQFSFAAEGPAFEIIADEVADLEVQEGPYKLSGKIELQPDRIDFTNIELDRDSAHLTLDLGLGLPVSDLRITYDMRARGSDVRTILAGAGPLMLKELPVSIDARGELKGSYLKFENFNVVIGDAQMKTQGEIDIAGDGGTSELHSSGNIPSLARFATLDGQQLRDQGISWSADLSGGGGELRVDNLVTKLGDSDVNGKIYFKGGDVPELYVNIDSESIVFAPLREESDYEYEPEPEFEDGKFIPDVAVPFEAMKQMNASLDIDIKELQRETLFMRDIELNVDLRDGALKISKAGFKAWSGAMVAQGSLEPVGDSGTASIQLVARQFALGMSQTDRDVAMTGDIDVNLRMTGADLRTLLGNINGEFFVNARGGRVTNNRFLQALYGDLLQEILTTINPFRQTDPYTEFECIIVPLRFDDGIVTSAPNSFISTSKMRMVATSSINLKNEEIQITVRTTPQRTLSISAGELMNPYAQVVGTMAAPRLAVDEKGLLISGGAAVATGGLSLLARGVWDRVSRSKDPCGETTRRAIVELGDRFPDLEIEGSVRLE